MTRSRMHTIVEGQNKAEFNASRTEPPTVGFTSRQSDAIGERLAMAPAKPSPVAEPVRPQAMATDNAGASTRVANHSGA